MLVSATNFYMVVLAKCMLQMVCPSLLIITINPKPIIYFQSAPLPKFSFSFPLFKSYSKVFLITLKKLFTKSKNKNKNK